VCRQMASKIWQDDQDTSLRDYNRSPTRKPRRLHMIGARGLSDDSHTTRPRSTPWVHHTGQRRGDHAEESRPGVVLSVYAPCTVYSYPQFHLPTYMASYSILSILNDWRRAWQQPLRTAAHAMKLAMHARVRPHPCHCHCHGARDIAACHAYVNVPARAHVPIGTSTTNKRSTDTAHHKKVSLDIRPSAIYPNGMSIRAVLPTEQWQGVEGVSRGSVNTRERNTCMQKKLSAHVVGDVVVTRSGGRGGRRGRVLPWAKWLETSSSTKWERWWALCLGSSWGTA
jgi:hypothetical protein